jgi:hypothetical protein
MYVTRPVDMNPVGSPRFVRRSRIASVVFMVLGGLAHAGSASAQAPEARTGAGGGGVVTGTVRDAVTGDAVPGATVVLEPDVAGAFPGPATGSGFSGATRATTAGADGRYRFEDLPSGAYRLYFSRLGYRPYSLVVELRGVGGTAVSVGLEAEPVALHPVRARAQPRGPYEAGYAFADDVAEARLMAIEMRRRLHLTTDVRELTHADVVESVTLGEPDVLRALQRLPGVTTRSDYTAELWTRGAPWSHTRVYYDGVPLFNPLHALGMISGIGSTAVGAAWFHPGVRPAGIGEGAAGVVDLQTRRAGGHGEMNAQADVSLMTAGLALDQRVLDGRAGWMLAARRTYLDWLADLARRAASREEESFPYGFSEVAGRVDASLGGATVLEASGLWEADELSSDGSDELDPLVARWGNWVGRLTLGTRVRGLDLRHTVASSQHHGLVTVDRGETIPSSYLMRRASESRVEYAALSGTVSPEPASLAGPAWTVGYGLERHAVGYYGPYVPNVPRSTSVMRPEAGGVLASPGGTLWWNDRLPVGVAWGERVWSRDDRVAVRTGLRLEGGDRVANGGSVRVAPRLSARYVPIPEVALSAGVGRAYQYTQALAPGGVHLASLVSTDVWLLAGPSVPALRSDLATLGLETWLAPARVASLNTFARKATGVATPDPRPGPVFDSTRAVFVVGQNVAYGVEASVRQLAGPVTGTLSYAHTRSQMTAAGLRYTSPAERSHVFDLTAMARVSRPLRLGAAFTAASGVPFTRTIADEDECALEPGCDPDRLPWAGEPHGLRAPTFASLDLLADWNTDLGGTELGIYVQLRNVLGRRNGTVYVGEDPGCLGVACGSGALQNLYERGVPRLPVLGVRVRR